MFDANTSVVWQFGVRVSEQNRATMFWWRKSYTWKDIAKPRENCSIGWKIQPLGFFGSNTRLGILLKSRAVGREPCHPSISCRSSQFWVAPDWFGASSFVCVLRRATW